MTRFTSQRTWYKIPLCRCHTLMLANRVTETRAPVATFPTFAKLLCGQGRRLADSICRGFPSGMPTISTHSDKRLSPGGEKFLSIGVESITPIRYPQHLFAASRSFWVPLTRTSSGLAEVRDVIRCAIEQIL